MQDTFSLFIVTVLQVNLLEIAAMSKQVRRVITNIGLEHSIFRCKDNNVNN